MSEREKQREAAHEKEIAHHRDRIRELYRQVNVEENAIQHKRHARMMEMDVIVFTVPRPTI